MQHAMAHLEPSQILQDETFCENRWSFQQLTIFTKVPSLMLNWF